MTCLALVTREKTYNQNLEVRFNTQMPKLEIYLAFRPTACDYCQFG